MNNILKVKYKNCSHCILDGPIDVIEKVYNEYSFFAPDYNFHPKFMMGVWDGKIHLYNYKTKEFPIGLVPSLIENCEILDISCLVDESVKNLVDPIDFEIDFFDRFKFYSKNKEIYPREDQLSAIEKAIKFPRLINIAPTSFGKSLCIFMQCLYHIEQKRKCLIIVPTVSLVNQFKYDIIDYCTDENNDSLNHLPNIHTISAGASKIISDETDIVISTWQSIYKESEEWFNRFDAIILDEAHKGKANCIREALNKCTQVKYRTGWTGSLKNDTLNSLQAIALLGPVNTVTTTTKLMENGSIANLVCKLVNIQYPDEIKKEYWKISKGKDYKFEIDFIENNELRNNLLITMSCAFEQTGIILFTHIQHGKNMVEIMNKKFPNRNYYFITGNECIRNGIKYKNFETELKPLIEKEKDSIIIASYGVFSTGISIKNIKWLMFAAPTKSYVRTIQSIGRSLRISDIKKEARVIDIIDDLSILKGIKSKRPILNYCMNHFNKRFQIYMEQGFEYDTKTFLLKNY